MAEFYGVFSREVAEIRQPVKHFTYVKRILESGRMSDAVKKIEAIMKAHDKLHLVTPHRDLALDFAQKQKGFLGYIDTPGMP